MIDSLGRKFQIKTGVRQGGILSPILFNACIDFVLKQALDEKSGGVTIWPINKIITDLTFVDDVALLACSMIDLQEMINRVAAEAGKIGLQLSSAKSKYIAVELGPDDLQHLFIGQDKIEKVDSFTYLGSQISATGESKT